MKNTKFLLMAAFLMVASTSFGQLYVKLGSGYYINGFNSETAYERFDGSITDSSSYSLGGGIPVNLAIGLGLTEKLSVELEGEYLLGSEVRSVNNTSTVGNTTTTDINTTQIRLIPTLVYSSGDEGLSFYGKLGAVLPMGGGTESVTNSDVSGGYMIKGESEGAFALGFRAGAGVTLAITDALSIYGGLQATYLNIEGTKATITAWEEGGADVLANKSTFVKETIYVDSPDANQMLGSATPDLTKPNEAAIQDPTSFGSYGLQIGIKINLGGDE